MYKILIAEDEWFIRNSIIKEVDWARADCEVVASARDGQEALELIEQFSPDIVISDIKMDGMDGLELCSHINKLYSEIKIIFITGHSEFEFAQSALKMGVKDFLLKPTDPEKLLESVERVVKEIEISKSRKLKFTELQKIVSENIPILREKFFIELVNGKYFSSIEIKQKQKFLNINAHSFYIVTGEFDNYDNLLKDHLEEEVQVIQLMVKDICEDLLNQCSLGYYIKKDANLFFMFAQCNNIVEFTECIQQRITDYVDITLSFGISEEANCLESVLSCYEHTLEALRQTFYLGNNCIIEYTDLKKEDKHILPATYTNNMVNSIMQNVKSGNSKDSIYKLGVLFEEITMLRHEDHFYIRNVAFELIVLIQRFLQDISEDPQTFFKELHYYEEITNCKTINKIENLLCQIISKVASLVEDKNKKVSETVINKIVDYLRSYYFKDISLDDLGKIVFMNPKYVCRLIKKETGSNFSDILLTIRIDKAKELLQEPVFKTFEIAEKVGIKDSRYFSQVFKKYVGITPTEYKQQFIM